ncbi:hypothetical protein C8J56DRAFT_436178 [Mycena floridula]|nr:hypothetical protein C8J56DRAFT_436178 [Mycena floridula]
MSAFKRFASTITIKEAVSKSHLHQPIPSSSFPLGYLVSGVHAGVKKKQDVPDLAVVLSTSEQTSAAACFTKNAFKAAPVLVSEQILTSNRGRARAIVVNSGCANAVTGRQGLEDAWAMVKETDALFKGQNETLVMSTGVIGQSLPISKILSAIRAQNNSLSADFSAWENAAKAFMTTDTFPKLRARKFTLDGVEYSIAGMDKGAGMIHPDMGPPRPGPLHATLLGCILTDAPVEPESLQSALTYAVERSFNSISVDGDMSTNDTIIVLANGAKGPGPSGIIHQHDNPQQFREFRQVLTEFAVDLAKLVVRDGEGATKFVTVTVKGAQTYEDAHKIASRISTSALVKTALYGEDANWGRILAATGSVSLSKELDPTKVSVTFVPSDGSTPLPVLVAGEPEKVDEARASQILQLPDFEVSVDLNSGGTQEATYYTCDLSYEYVQINGDYRS